METGQLLFNALTGKAAVFVSMGKKRTRVIVEHGKCKNCHGYALWKNEHVREYRQ